MPSKVTPQARFRLQLKHGTALGPGKAELLERIAASGSIRAAAEEMGMGYRTAWQMVQSMNEHFTSPLVDQHRGGASRGGAQLTATGLKVLKTYRAMEQRALKSIAKEMRTLDLLIKS